MPLNRNVISPRSHFISLKSTNVESNLIDVPCFCILHKSDGNNLDTSGTVERINAPLEGCNYTWRSIKTHRKLKNLHQL